MASASDAAAVDGAEFRRVLGHYPTGVCAVTALDGDASVGMIVGSFTSVSLDPPLVALFPARSSTTWPRIAAHGRFAVIVLAEGQRDACRALAASAADKFDAVPHHRSATGLPRLAGAVATIECTLDAVHEAGDHLIAIGRVETLEADPDARPMLFFRAGYHGLAPL